MQQKKNNDEQVETQVQNASTTEQSKDVSSIWFYVILVALVAALGFVLVGTGNKKK